MSTSAEMRENRKALAKGAAFYGGAAAFCVLFAQVYALFGHGVRSASMTWMFLYPLAGALLALCFLLLSPDTHGRRLWPSSRNLMGCGLSVLTMGALLKGVFDIAGTASAYIPAYRVAGAVLVAASVILGLVMLAGRRHDGGSDGVVQ